MCQTRTTPQKNYQTKTILRKILPNKKDHSPKTYQTNKIQKTKTRKNKQKDHLTSLAKILLRQDPLNKQLLVAAAIGTRPADRDRVNALVAAGAVVGSRWRGGAGGGRLENKENHGISSINHDVILSGVQEKSYYAGSMFILKMMLMKCLSKRSFM